MIGFLRMKNNLSAWCLIALLAPSSARAVNIELGLDTVFILPFDYEIYFQNPTSPTAQSILSTTPSGVGLGAFLSLQFMDQHRVIMRYQNANVKASQEYDLSGMKIVEYFTSSYNEFRLDCDILFDLGSKSRWVIGFDLGYIWLNSQNLEKNSLPSTLPEEVNNNHKFLGVGLHTGFEVKYDFLFFGLYLHQTISSDNMRTSSASAIVGDYEVTAPQPLTLSTSVGFVF
jgi:hypothetical protein